MVSIDTTNNDALKNALKSKFIYLERNKLSAGRVLKMSSTPLQLLTSNICIIYN